MDRETSRQVCALAEYVAFAYKHRQFSAVFVVTYSYVVVWLIKIISG